MAVGPGLRSRVVAILKLGLPLVAIALLAPLFLIQTERRQGGSLVFSPADLAALGEGMRVSDPVFSGETADGDRFRFTAALVVPDAAPPTRAEVETLRGEIELAQGGRMTISAPSARIDLAAERLEMAGPVEVTTDDGYRFSAAAIDVDLAAGGLVATGDVRGAGPMGRIAADRLDVGPPERRSESRKFLFDGGVRLIYDPPDVGR